MGKLALRRKPTLKDVAEKAGVSVQTVLRYYKNTNISPITHKHIGTTIKELNYRPNAAARSLRRQETLTIGLAIYHKEYIGDSNNAFFPLLLQGLVPVVGAHGYNLQILETDPKAVLHKRSIYYKEKVLDRGVDGLIVVDSIISDEEIMELEKERIAFVVVRRLLQKMPGRCVIPDEHAKVYRLGKFLLERGHRRIAYFGIEKKFIETTHSLQGLSAALAEYGAKLDERDMVLTQTEGVAMAAMEAILSRDDAPTAAICTTDFLTDMLTRRLLHGLAVPKGFEYAGETPRPENVLSKNFVYGVKPVGRKLGYEAGEVLIELLANGVEHTKPCVVEVGEFAQARGKLGGILKDV